MLLQWKWRASLVRSRSLGVLPSPATDSEARLLTRVKSPARRMQAAAANGRGDGLGGRVEVTG